MPISGQGFYKYSRGFNVVMDDVNSTIVNDNEIRLDSAVRYSGIGSFKALQERLFESFVQVDSSNTRKCGARLRKSRRKR
jgi:hypothetical protein